MLSTDCPATDFVAPPQGSAARVARSYRARIQLQALDLLRRCEQRLRIDLSALQSRIGSWVIGRRWSPAPYAVTHDLLQAMEKGNLDAVFEAIHEMQLLPDSVVYDADFRISSILTERWERAFVAELRSNPSRSATGKSILVRPLLGPPPARVVEALEAAIATIRSVDPLIGQEWDTYMSRIKLFAGRSAIGVSAPRVLGATFLKIPAAIDPYASDLHSYFVNQLVHELGHVHLLQLQSQDHMVVNGEEPVHTAPIRKDPRPMNGVFHATFVLSRCIRMHEKVLERHPDNPHFRFILERSYDQIAEGMRSVERSARLTPLGDHFYATVRSNYIGRQAH